MEIAVKTLFLDLSPKIFNYKQKGDSFLPSSSCKRPCFPPQVRYEKQRIWLRSSHICHPATFAALSDVETVGVSSSQFEDFSVTTNGTNADGELKVSIEVSGARTRTIFDDVFNKMVAEAQPIPGFRRVKGGKTPNIPRDILLEILGPSKVYKQVIKGIINSIVAEYVEKEGLKVEKDLRVEQSFEDLEEMFEPDENFSFVAIIQLQKTTA